MLKAANLREAGPITLLRHSLMDFPRCDLGRGLRRVLPQYRVNLVHHSRRAPRPALPRARVQGRKPLAREVIQWVGHDLQRPQEYARASMVIVMQLY